MELKGRKRNDTEKSFIFYVNDFLISCELSPPEIICMYVYLYRCQSVLHSTALYFTVLQCTALYCAALYCTVLYCTVLYCTVMAVWQLQGGVNVHYQWARGCTGHQRVTTPSIRQNTGLSDKYNLPLLLRN